MSNEFKKITQDNVTRYVLESDGGTTSSGSIASNDSAGFKKGALLTPEGNKKAEPPKPRNFVAKNAKMGGAGAHTDKKKAAKQGQEKHKKPYMEEFNGEYDDEAGMAHNGLHTIMRAVKGLESTIKQGDNLPEWCQEKLSLAEDYLVTVWDYLQSEQGVAEGWKDKLAGAALAGSMALGGGAHAGGWEPSDVPAGGHNQLPDIVAHVKFKVGDKEINKEINLGSHYRSPGEAGEELKNFLNSKGIKFYQYSLERVKPKADDKIDSSPATSDMKGSMDTTEPAATGPSRDDYMAKDNDPANGPSTGGKFTKEGAKVDRQAKHITASMMKKGKSKKDAESIAWAHIKHPKSESADSYFESLTNKLAEKLDPNAPVDDWVQDFAQANPEKYHQFRQNNRPGTRKSEKKIERMAQAASYAAKTGK